ncbi:hypothetical protein FRB96_003333 [Tulasnella sp. 330]|nr:hypothetical protein FRB96_003333 [Tulasnella sp. 330]
MGFRPMGAEVTTVKKSVGSAKCFATGELQIDEQMMVSGKEERAPIARSLLTQSSGLSASRPDNMDYSIPQVVDTFRAGRFGSWGAAAMVTILFASIEAMTIPILRITSDLGHESASATRMFLILSYAGLILNASTTFTALILIDRLGNLTLRSTEAPHTLTRRWPLGTFGTSKITWNIAKLFLTALIAVYFTICTQIFFYTAS